MIVLCPLEYERRALRRTARVHHFHVVCTGPGNGAAQWVRENGSRVMDADETVVLAGLAAGLVSHATAGSVWQAGAVVVRAAEGSAPSAGAVVLRPTAFLPSVPSATIASVTEVLQGPVEKRRVAADTGATLADMESGPFAAAAHAALLRWAVIRGISDPVDMHLPLQVAAWTSPDGKTRFATVARDVMRHPHLVPALFRTGRISSAAMRGVAHALAAASQAAYNTQPESPPRD